ncbi:MAG: hypothetical protein L6Q92_02740 [Phycisphaerae bacterium]|nr:hypothetical protein [Phycisphaerae bacterium]
MAIPVLLFNAVAPFLGVIAVLSFARWSARGRGTSPDLPAWSGPVALTLAFVATFGGLLEWPAIPPVESWQWLVFLVPAAGAWGIVDAVLRSAFWSRALIEIGLLALAAWLLVPEWFESRFIAVAVLASATFVMTVAHRAACPSSAPAAVPLACALTFIGTAVLLERSANAKLAQLAGSLTVALLAATAFAAWTRRSVLTASSAPLLAFALAGLLFNGHANDYANVPLWSFVLIASVPLVLAALRVVLTRAGLRPFSTASSMLLAVVLILSTAVCGAVLSSADAPLEADDAAYTTTE